MAMFRKRTQRTALALEVRYRSTGSFLISYSTNLSSGGLFLESTQPLPEGTPLKLTLRVPAGGSSAEPPVDIAGLSGRVAWVRKPPGEPGRPAGMGVAFANLDQTYGALIDRLVQDFGKIRMLVVSRPGALRSMLTQTLAGICTCVICEQSPGEDVLASADAAPDLIIAETDALNDEQLARLVQGAPWIALGDGEEATRRGKEQGAYAILPVAPSFRDLSASVLGALAKPWWRAQ